MYKIVGQTRIKDIFESSIKKNRLAHSYLFYGQPGVGKDCFALSLAMGLNCSTNKIWACGECKYCKNFLQFHNPYFTFIQPVPSRPGSMNKDKYLEIVREANLERINNPYHEVEFPSTLTKLPQISINEIRTIKQKIRLRIAEDKYRIFIISKIQHMSAEACNSLLKILEEPPPRTILFLTTSNSGSVLPTIISRCQLVHFDPLTKDEISNTLITDFNINSSTAEFIGKISEGSLQKALRIAEEGFEDVRTKAYEFLKQSINKDELKAITYAETFIKQNDKIEAKKILLTLQILVRDILQLKLGLPHQVINIDIKTSLENVLAAYPDIDAERSLDYLAKSVDLIDKNVYLDLIIQNLRQSLNNCFIKK
ncbi:MAG: hypothetical protein R6V04_00165 [bacterium]